MALEAILQVVPPEMMAGLAVKRTAKEASEAIRAMRFGSDRVQKGKV
jgi:acetyl-CoA carboxylase alpha subunit